MLPCLDAVIKEAGRIHPPFSLPYERVVPPEGAVICGKWLPGGTAVGMSAWVTRRDYELFGHDADVWRPERSQDGERFVDLRSGSPLLYRQEHFVLREIQTDPYSNPAI